MMTRLPAGTGNPVPCGNRSGPEPGDQLDSRAELVKSLRGALGRVPAPKQVQPLPKACCRLAWAALDGFSRNSAAWWSSLLPGRKTLEMMYALLLMWGSSRTQW